MKPRISMITLGVSDIAKSVAFYRDGLGFPTHNYEPGDDNVMFRLYGTWLGLYPLAKLAEDATVPQDGAGFRGVTLSHNVSSKLGADRLFQQAVAVGAVPVKMPQDVFWGGYSGYFADPDGHLWEVAWNPFADLT